MWSVVLALLGFAWARFQWITSLQARLFTVLTGSVKCHRILAAASRQIFSSGSFETYISLVVATWTLSTLVLGAISLAWVLGMMLYRSYRWLTRVSKKPLNPTASASEAIVAVPQAIAEPLPAFLDSRSMAATQEILGSSEPEKNLIDSVHDDTLVPFENLPVDARHASLPDYDSVDSISSVNSISGKAHSGNLLASGYEDSADSTMEDLFDTRFSGNGMTNQTRVKANLLISKITTIKRRLIERVTLEIASTHGDFSVGPTTRNEICKDLRNKLCRSEIHLSRIIGFIIQEAMGYSEYSLDHADPESFLSMSVDDIESYCSSIITGSAAWEVPPAPPSTRAATPTPEDEPRSFAADNSSVLRALEHSSKADVSALDSSSPCRNTLIFSASEEENLQDLLTDLKRLPPGSPLSCSRWPSSKRADSCDSEESFTSWYRATCKVPSGAHPSGGYTGADTKGRLYEPLSPISPFIGGRDSANQSFSTSTPRGPKSFNAADEATDTSMVMDTSAILDTTMITETSMILDDSSLDTIRIGTSASAGVGPDESTMTGVSTGAASASANISRRWSAKINSKDRGRAAQEPNTPPHTPLAVVSGILRARAAHAERRQAKRKEQADAAAAVAEHGAYASRRRGHVRSGSSTAGKV